MILCIDEVNFISGQQNSTSSKSQVSYIINKDTGTIASFKAPFTLGADVTRSIWVTWEKRIVKVGFGATREDSNWFMEAPYTHTFEVNSVGFATPRSDARWMLSRDQGRANQIELPDKGHQYESFEISLRGSDRFDLINLNELISHNTILLLLYDCFCFSFVFQVLSFGTVYIDLETSSEGYGWTLVIGAEDNTITRLEHNEVTVHHTVNYLAMNTLCILEQANAVK